MAPECEPPLPLRRRVILDSTLRVIATTGLHKTTHRLIARDAGISPGSVTYHFSDLSQLFEESFAHLVAQMSADYCQRLQAATTGHEACQAVVGMLCGPGYLDSQRMTLLFEMYSFGNFNPTVRELCRHWLESSHASLRLHFSQPTCSALDALIEGWPMHAHFQGVELDRNVVERTIHAIVNALESGEPPVAPR